MMPDERNEWDKFTDAMLSGFRHRGPMPPALADEIRKIVRDEIYCLGGALRFGPDETVKRPQNVGSMAQTTAEIDAAAIRMLDRRRATMRRNIMAAAILSALLAWGIVGLGFFLAWLMR